MPEMPAALERELASLIGVDSVLPGTTRAYLSDATETRSVHGRADAVALPSSPDEVAAVVRWCYDHDVAIVPRGGGTGYAGGAVPLDGGIVLSLERLRHLTALDPELWRMHVQAGLTTADVHRLARENGLLFAPDPGAAEQSLIGGNIATNAGGPHAFKYGVTAAWVSGLQIVLAPGELVTVGGAVRKDVAGYDIKSLMIGSEGTLGIVTAAWLKLLPAPEQAFPVAALYRDAGAGCAAVGAVLGSGAIPAALEFLDQGTVRAAPGLFEEEGFVVIAEADGSAEEAAHVRGELIEAMSDGAKAVHAPTSTAEIAALWRWRSGVSLAVVAKRGGKVSEDIVVPGDRLQEAIEATLEIGSRHQLPACSWGHAGDGNLHSTFMIDLEQPAELERAEQAAQELFALAVELGGSISGEHGIGIVKRGALSQQWAPAALAAHEAIKKAFDPKGLLNPGKKSVRPHSVPPHGVRPHSARPHSPEPPAR